MHFQDGDIKLVRVLAFVEWITVSTGAYTAIRRNNIWTGAVFNEPRSDLIDFVDITLFEFTIAIKSTLIYNKLRSKFPRFRFCSNYMAIKIG
jgi:hypothetical protein